MKSFKNILAELARALGPHPDYVLYYAVLVVFVVVGGLLSFLQKVPWLLFGSFGLALLGALYLSWISSKKAKSESITPIAPAHSQEDPLRDALREEIKHVYEMVDAPWLKEDLEMVLEIVDYQDPSQGRAKFRFHGKFRVKNTSHKAVDFVFVTQIDVSRHYTEPVNGELIITNRLDATIFAQCKYTYKPAGDPRGLEHLYRKTFQLPPKAEHVYEWHTDVYEIDIPYAEFWATAHPLMTMKLEVQFNAVKGLLSHGDCYRRLDEPGRFSAKSLGTRYLIHAEGAFLPYQGIFVEIQS